MEKDLHGSGKEAKVRAFSALLLTPRHPGESRNPAPLHRFKPNADRDTVVPGRSRRLRKALDGGGAVGQKVLLGNFAEAGTASMAAALASPCRIRGKRRWVRQPVSGRSVYAYVMGNPISYVDPYGLEVQVCMQPAFGITGNPIDHHWIRTDTVEAGMGGTRGNVPGNESGDRPGDPVQVTDHRGRHREEGAKCETVTGVDEEKVNALLEIGRPLGRWGPTNQCQSFVRNVLHDAASGRHVGGGGGGSGR